jgi:hypothetical protein
LWGSLVVAEYSIYVTLDFRMPRSDASRHNLLLAKRTAMASPTGEIRVNGADVSCDPACVR